jgi:hypothetical protein
MYLLKTDIKKGQNKSDPEKLSGRPDVLELSEVALTKIIVYTAATKVTSPENVFCGVDATSKAIAGS